MVGVRLLGNNQVSFGVYRTVPLMRLRLFLFLISVIVAVPIALGVVMAVNALRARDAATTIERIAASMATQLTKDSCESDPNWFLAGPRGAPPSLADRQLPDADVRLPRPSTEELPLEFFAYNDQYEASSTAGPRFPVDFRNTLRASPPVRTVRGPFQTSAGQGVQMARATGWSPGPCAVLLFRLRPAPNHFTESLMVFVGAFAACLAFAVVVAGPTIMRIGRLAKETRESARQDFTAIVPASGGDEIGSLGATFNEVGADIRRRIVDSKEREEALRRYVADVTDGVAQPLVELEAHLADQNAVSAEAARVEALRRTHELSGRLLNLAAVAQLRTSRERLTRDRVDMNALVTRVLTARTQMAGALGVTTTTAMPRTPAVITGNTALFERAVANLVDNALLYNQPGGRVAVEIAQYEGHGRFSLRVIDTGRGVSDEDFTGLTAIRRFRGDEGREKRPGVPGLGLAVAREVAERFGYSLELRRPAAGGFEVEFAGTGNE
jgi:signal transduction histidine kinase